MKIAFYIFIFLVACSVVSADPLSIEIERSEYSSGETFQAEIEYSEELLEDITYRNFELINPTGEIVDISPFVFELDDGHYYIYFNLDRDLIVGNYSLFVDDLSYLKNNLIVQTNQTSEFSIVPSNQTLSISPGVIILDSFSTSEVFNFFVVNSGSEDLDIFLESSDSNSIDFTSNSLYINSGNSGIFDVYVDNLIFDRTDNQFLEIFYGDKFYSVLVWAGELQTSNVSSESNLVSFVSAVNNFNISISSNESKEGFLEVGNFYDYSVAEINLGLTGNLEEVLNLEIVSLDSISAGETSKIYININENLNSLPGHYYGNITLNSGSDFDYFPVYIEIEGAIPNNFSGCGNDDDCNIGYFCNLTSGACIAESVVELCSSDLDCPSGFVCNTDSGSCYVEPEEKSIKGIISVIVILILLIMLGYFLHKKVKNRPNQGYPFLKPS